MSETQPPGFLIKMPAAAAARLEARPLMLAGASFRLRPLCPNEDLGRPPEAASGSRWYLAAAPPGALTAAELWEMAHQALAPQGALAGVPDVYLEPDLYHAWKYDNPVQAVGAAPGQTCFFNDQAADLPQGPSPQRPAFAWHLWDDFSQLKQARDQVAQAGPAPVRVGILDVGFDFGHHTRPQNLRLDLQRNFVADGQAADDARDYYERGLFSNPGHGTATLALLAGNLLTGMTPAAANTNDYLGGAPLAEIIPVRLANSVILLRTSALVEALDYLIAPQGNPALRAEVVSMSLGGLASQAWADVVNRAYEAGLCLVTAAGNNFFGTPQSIVFPARFQRVLAACGVMADGRPYSRDQVPFYRMAGNYGPASKMATALAAYTPNVPWAEINCPQIVDMDGAGTSAATPQIAAAATLWLQKYKKQLAYVHPWEQVEAVRQALFASADRSSPYCQKYFGQGILRAAAALQVQPPARLVKTPPDNATLAFLRVLTGVGVAATPQEAMLATEAFQLLQQDEKLEQTIADPDLPAAQIPEQEIKNFLDAAIASNLASPTLQRYLEGIYTKRFGGPGPAAPLQVERARFLTDREVETPPPVHRRLRSYAFDPELSTRLETAQINAAVLAIPWEPDLQPGPVGEYVEVIDHDPASGCFYAPVDLNDPFLLATDGLAPSEGNPKFHQQMVYAVAMRTIHNVELALGRKALWSYRKDQQNRREFVEKLRIYPHALRERNAFYQPDLKALLFGYFPAGATDPGQHYPGGMVFTCLSHDIVAHETTHAILDGMYPTFIRPDNEDQLAFHEAFADIVALFQHFSLPEVLRHQVSKTRGDLRARNLLGELAQQFGQASGMRGALRSAIGRIDPETGVWRPLEPDPSLYLTETEPHARGALLVAAVFDAFLAIYETRIADLLRLATSGTGILPSGAIHPDLVGRLCDEAAKVAGHVLTMCIRALDYCPPVDLTFGDYLRALITADYDMIPDDPLGYRLAFVEAFRSRGLYPRDLRSLAIDALRWRPARDDQSENLLRPVFSRLREYANRIFNVSSRRELFQRSQEWQQRVHRDLTRLFADLRKNNPAKLRKIMVALGLDLTTGRETFEVQGLSTTNKQGPDLNPVRPQILLTLVQDRQVPAAGGGPPLRFSGGCTVIADKRRAQVKYYVSKNSFSSGRLARTQAFHQRLERPLADLYFGATPLAGLAQRFALLHADKEVY